MEENNEIINASKEVFHLTKGVPELTDLQLKKKYEELRNEDAPDASREWYLEAVVRLIQHQYYKDHNISVPVNIDENFKKFFKKKISLTKKRKTPRKKDAIDRATLDGERIKVLHLIANICASSVSNGSTTFHPQNKYATVKSGKSVVMFIEKKLRNILVYMGGERERTKNPKLTIKIGTEENDIEIMLKQFVKNHIDNFMHRRDKRWSKCEYVLKEVVKHFKTELQEYNDLHSHPSGRYTTFKRGRLVLVFITQDRAKGEVAFHPGGERENNSEFTTTIKANDVQNSVDVKNKVTEFLSTHYVTYMNSRNLNLQKHKEELQKMLSLCSKVVTHDVVFQHPKDFFGLIKNGERPLLMIKRNGAEGCYSIVAWVKKQKHNPAIEVNVTDSEDDIATKTRSLVKEHLDFALSKGV